MAILASVPMCNYSINPNNSDSVIWEGGLVISSPILTSTNSNYSFYFNSILSVYSINYLFKYLEYPLFIIYLHSYLYFWLFISMIYWVFYIIASSEIELRKFLNTYKYIYYSRLLRPLGNFPVGTIGGWSPMSIPALGLYEEKDKSSLIYYFI